MVGAQVFTCNYSGSIKNKLLKGGEKLFLKIEDNKISGKGFICNEEGRNGYIDNFEYPINDVREVFKGEYQGNQALIMNTRITSLYGTKKAQTIFPSIKDIDTVIEILGSIKENTASSNLEPKAATTQSQPIAPAAQVAPAAPATAPAPAPVAPKPEMQIIKSDEPITSANVIIKKESPLRPAGSSSVEASTGSALLNSAPKAAAPTASAVVGSAVASKPAAPAKEKDSSEDFENRMKKLYVLKECGMLNDKEFDAKKLELVSELCGMTDFNEKVQKLVVLKECGMLSDKEFEIRKIDIIKECCSTDVDDLDEYKRNVERLPYLKLGGMISDDEFEEKKLSVIKEVEYKDSDGLDVLLKKLERWPVLRETEMFTADEYAIRVQALVDSIDVHFEDSIATLTKKLNKWPILVQAKLISENEFKKKQAFVIEEFVGAPWSTVDEFKAVVERLMTLKNCEWLSELDFHARKVELLKKVAAVEDYVVKVQLYIALPGIGLISEGDYQLKKQEFIDEIFSPYTSMDDFQLKVKKLMDLEKTGMVSSDEFTNYKMKLMSEL